MHLSSEGLSRWIAGERSPEDREHIQTCANCRAEVRELQNTLSSYSEFAREWGRGLAPVEPSLPQLLRESRRPVRLARWTGLASVAAAAILVFVLPTVDKDRKTQPAGDDSTQDTLLLEQVNTHLSRTAPMAMEPLLILLEDKDSTRKQTGEER